ncbi:MAG: hypothetical protein AVDCRST_MAG17-2015 [uncultured Solirubrobacterales bacterium]|uniref:Uncharacterized protein n=1 Tax=uncultured Solirubrobacterales bacterium TaxID=768556 RepID=A0A6J4T1C1_9ACTN|nr:MAG: hypothetical protein AVDCRST_MAG17-2015 [uncultured Solirubrobacterales bacterium]
MNVADLTLVRGMDDTRAAPARWSRRPGPVVGAWVARSFAVAVGLLIATWVIASFSTPDPTPLLLPGITTPPTSADLGPILFRNSLVLALHAFACLAGFLAGASMPPRGRSPQRRLEGEPRLGRHTRDLVHHPGHRLLALHPGVRARAGTSSVAAQLGTSPGSSSSACFHTRYPSSRPCSCRSLRGWSRAVAASGTSCSRRPS